MLHPRLGKLEWSLILLTGGKNQIRLYWEVRYTSLYLYEQQNAWLMFCPGGRVTRGFNDGLLGMCEGEKREIVIPPELGFGDQGAMPNIPGGATLLYKVECLQILDPRRRDLLPPGNVWKDIDIDGDWIATLEEVTNYWTKKRNQAGIPNNLFEKDDENKVFHLMISVDLMPERGSAQDGVVTWEEFGGPKGSQGPLSWNGDEILPNNPLFPPVKKLKGNDDAEIHASTSSSSAAAPSPSIDSNEANIKEEL